MKKILNIGCCLSLLALMSTGCKKEAEKIADFTTVPSSQALLKINVVSMYLANPSFQLKVNDARVSNLITARTPFPGGGFNTSGDNRPDYLPVDPGAVKVAATIPKKNTNTDSVSIFSTSVNLAAGKYFTLHVTDTAANTKYVLLEDDITFPAVGTSRYRFVHLIPNVAALDLYHGTTLVASNIPYLGNTVIIRPTLGAAQGWTVREAGSGPTGAVLATYTSANTVIDQRGYTIFAMGYKLSSTTDVRRPFLSFLLNK